MFSTSGINSEFDIHSGTVMVTIIKALRAKYSGAKDRPNEGSN